MYVLQRSLLFQQLSLCWSCHLSWWAGGLRNEEVTLLQGPGTLRDTERLGADCGEQCHNRQMLHFVEEFPLWLNYFLKGRWQCGLKSKGLAGFIVCHMGICSQIKAAILARADVNFMGIRGDHSRRWFQMAYLSTVKSRCFALSDFDASLKSRRGHSLLPSLINTRMLYLDGFISGHPSIFCSHIKPGGRCFVNVAKLHTWNRNVIFMPTFPFSLTCPDSEVQNSFPSKVPTHTLSRFHGSDCGQSKSKGIHDFWP